MLTTTLAAIPALEVVLFRKYNVSLGAFVIIFWFQVFSGKSFQTAHWRKFRDFEANKKRV